MRHRFLMFLGRHRLLKIWLILSPAVIWVFLFSFIPLLIMIYHSFVTKGALGQIFHIYTLANYEKLSLLYLGVFWRSIRLAGMTTFFCFIIGYAVAYWIALYGGRWKNFLIFLIVIPSWSSLLVRIYAWLFLFRDSGIINYVLLKNQLIQSPIPMTFNEVGVLGCLIYTYLPFMILPLYATIAKLDRSVMEAALDLGATPFQRLIKVTIPMTKGGIISGIVLTFIPSIGEYLIPDLVGGAKVTMMGNLIADKFLTFRNWPLGSAITTALLIVILLFIFIYAKYEKQSGLFGGGET
jgi:spermidine/putrescine transport system permease protein